MKTITLLIAVVFLCNQSFAQKSAEHTPSKEFKAEKVQKNDNPPAKKVELPADIPVMDFSGDIEQNFLVFIKAKDEWYQNNPDYLKNRVGITRVSASFIDGLSSEVNLFVEEHKNQFEIVGVKKD